MERILSSGRVTAMSGLSSERRRSYSPTSCSQKTVITATWRRDSQVPWREFPTAKDLPAVVVNDHLYATRHLQKGWGGGEWDMGYLNAMERNVLLRSPTGNLPAPPPSVMIDASAQW